MKGYFALAFLWILVVVVTWHRGLRKLPICVAVLGLFLHPAIVSSATLLCLMLAAQADQDQLQTLTTTAAGTVAVETDKAPTIQLALGEDKTASNFDLMVTVLNPKSSAAIDVPETMSMPMCKIGLFDVNGKPVTYTPLGLNTVGAHTRELGIWVGYDSRLVRLKLGEKHTWVISLNEFFHLRPGKFTLDLGLTAMSHADAPIKRTSWQVEVKKFPFDVADN